MNEKAENDQNLEQDQELEQDQDLDERRAKRDRREFVSALNDSTKELGEIVIQKDRRKMPERRLNNISVEETEIVEEEFLEYLQHYQNKS